jgi:hypothetical protein
MEYNDYDGAKEFLFLLIHIIEDATLIDALKVHLIACSKEIDLDTFYDNSVDTQAADAIEQYGYFIIHFTFELNEHLEQNSAILDKEFTNLKHLLD